MRTYPQKRGKSLFRHAFNFDQIFQLQNKNQNENKSKQELFFYLNKEAFPQTNLRELPVDLSPAQKQLRLLVTDLLQTFQLLQPAAVQNLQDFLFRLFQHLRV